MAKKQKLERHPQDDVKENLQDAPEDVKEFLHGETDELPEGAEEISNEEAAELEESAVQNYIKENLEEDAADPDASDEVEEENQPEAEPIDEQKKYVNLKASLEKEITELQQKNIELEQKADEIEDMVSTFCLESLYGLENQIKYSIKNNTDKNDIKEVKNEIKNLETVFAFETLLNEYKTLACEYRSNVTANENDIKNDKEKIKELEEKITCFQTKLDIADCEQRATDGTDEVSAEDPFNASKQAGDSDVNDDTGEVSDD